MKKQNFGFTLVELLIVIALIAILSVAVLATINPIEQTNKARDAKFKNDAAEVLNGYERYYASQNQYPWNAAGVGGSVPVETNGIAFLSTDDRFGVLGAAGDPDGLLISTSELKSAFGGKEPFASSVAASSVDAMYIYHNADSNYVCFCPKAKANRQGTVAQGLKCLTAVAADDTAPTRNSSVLRNAGSGADCTVPTAAQITSTDFCAIGGTFANLLCVPEGTVSD